MYSHQYDRAPLRTADADDRTALEGELEPFYLL